MDKIERNIADNVTEAWRELDECIWCGHRLADHGQDEKCLTFKTPAKTPANLTFSPKCELVNVRPRGSSLAVNPTSYMTTDDGALLNAVLRPLPCGCKVIGNGTLRHPLTVKLCAVHADARPLLMRLATRIGRRVCPLNDEQLEAIAGDIREVLNANR